MAKTIKVETELWKRIAQCAETAGYSSPEEFVQHVLEQQVAKLEASKDDDQVLEKLKGLGYID